MPSEATAIIFPAPDLPAAKAFFTTLLGTEPYADAAYYVGFRVNDHEIGLDPHGHADGPVAYWPVEDIGAEVAKLEAAGAKVHEQPRDVGGGMQVATLKDPNGNLVGLRQFPKS